MEEVEDDNSWSFLFPSSLLVNDADAVAAEVLVVAVMFVRRVRIESEEAVSPAPLPLPLVATANKSGKSSQKALFLRFQEWDCEASSRFSSTEVEIEPVVAVSSNINDSKPVRMVETDQAGFQESGW